MYCFAQFWKIVVQLKKMEIILQIFFQCLKLTNIQMRFFRKDHCDYDSNCHVQWWYYILGIRICAKTGLASARSRLKRAKWSFCLCRSRDKQPVLTFLAGKRLDTQVKFHFSSLLACRSSGSLESEILVFVVDKAILTNLLSEEGFFGELFRSRKRLQNSFITSKMVKSFLITFYDCFTRKKMQF